MPLQRGRDSAGRYVRWGSRGKRYHYSDKKGMMRARGRALRQARAIAYRRGVP